MVKEQEKLTFLVKRNELTNGCKHRYTFTSILDSTPKGRLYIMLILIERGIIMNQNKSQYCKEKTPDTLYKIGMFACMNQVTIKTLRHYDDENLLKPKVIDKETNYRYYTLSQMGELHQILALKKMGFKIDEIKAVFNGLNEKELLKKKKISS